jgi:tetratricopeptide (TPR) repeat protein
VTLAQSASPGGAVGGAIAALQRGDFQSAEKELRLEIAKNPDSAFALSMLGVALDQQNKLAEAAEVHRRAVAKAPGSTTALNNYATHLIRAGQEDEAKRIYLKVIALDPTHHTANLQLARLALNGKTAAQEMPGVEALRRLDRVPAAEQEDTQVLLLRMQALYVTGDNSRADALLSRLTVAAQADMSLKFAAGIALSNARQYGKAEIFFEAALQSDPANPDLLFNLGVVATYAGHLDRAREVLGAALRLQPGNVDVIYALARADEASKRWEDAARLLSEAARLDPKRADVQELLALTASELGALDDAAAAWDRYLKLKPNDEIGKRERSYTAIQAGKLEEGIAGLEKFLVRHPDDAVAHYELGQAERNRDAVKSLAHFDQSLQIDPNYVPARIARGSLFYQEGKPERALTDMEVAARLRPDDAANLDRLGQTYQALDRRTDAERVLRKAVDLAPDDSKIMLHFARALADAGKIEESKSAMDRFRQLGSSGQTRVRAGFVDYLSLTDEQRNADYRNRVENAVRLHPEDAVARLALLKLLLSDGSSDQVAETVRALAALKPAPSVLAEAGHALLKANRYALANDLLVQAAAAGPSTALLAAIDLDLATAATSGGFPARAIDLLNRVPESERDGAYYLARAETLAASGNNAEAAMCTDRALILAQPSPDFYLRAAAFLVRIHREEEALRFLDQAARVLPGNREVLLTRAAALGLLRRADAADRASAEIENRWPEWYAGWVVRAMILEMSSHPDQSLLARQMAVRLGAPADKVVSDFKSVVEGALF